MLVDFSVKNWRSFKDEATLSMVASAERHHKEHLHIQKLGNRELRLLPLAMIYGGNATGKSNIFKAMEFLKNFVAFGSTQPASQINVSPFRLDPVSITSPVAFTVRVMKEQTLYLYEVLMTRSEIVSERLSIISGSRAKELYSREGQGFTIGAELVKREREARRQNGNAELKSTFFDFLTQSVRPNVLFLTAAVMQNVACLHPLYSWFSNDLMLVSPGTAYAPTPVTAKNEEDHESEVFRMMLSRLDSGIEDIAFTELPFDQLLEQVPVPQQIKEQVTTDLLGNGSQVRGAVFNVAGEFYKVRVKDGQLIAGKMVTRHRGHDGSLVPFEVKDESDGTRRMMEIIPAFQWLTMPGAERTIFFDEIDRSLHPTLVKNLLRFFLERRDNCQQSQMLLTTHDVYQIDQGVVRRDELWITDRDRNGASSLYSFSDYCDLEKQLRSDLDLRKFYMSGRLGGIPNITLSDIE